MLVLMVMSVDLIHRVNALLRRLKRYVYNEDYGVFLNCHGVIT